MTESPAQPEGPPLLSIRGLDVAYRRDGVAIPVIDALDLTVKRGETLGLVGESGSGKSTLALALMGLLPRGRASAAGELRLDGHGDLMALPERAMQRLRGDRLAMIFQDPMTSLNPYMRVGRQLIEPLCLHRGLSAKEAMARIVELMASVGIEDAEARLRAYPHEFSGGMRQRAMIAMAMSCDPDLLVADEPTTALDVTTQKLVLEILSHHQRERQMAMLLITHDLGVVADTCDNVAVMYAGQIVEQGPVAEVLAAPRHPYTQALLRAIPSARGRRILRALPGSPPAVATVLGQCRLAARCPHAQDACRATPTPLREAAPGHHHRCRRDIPAPAVESLVEDTATESTRPVILEVRDLVVTYPGRSGWFTKAAPIHAVGGVSLTVRAGEVLGIAGESGSGKSTLIRAILQLVPHQSGTILLDGNPIDTGDLRSAWQHMQLIFQDPASSLDPRMTVADIITEPLRRYRRGDAQARDTRLRELMDQVGLKPEWRDRYPHEFSGGQQQRIGIARALALQPRILFCDEPVSALDVSIQAQILNLLQDLQSRLGMSLVFVSHDLAVVRTLCDRVLIMKDGHAVEEGRTGAVYDAPSHDYTRELLAAIPGQALD